MTLVGSHIFDLRRLISFRLGYTRPVAASDSLSDLEIPSSLFFTPDAPNLGQIQIPSMTPFGPSPFPPQKDVTNTFQFATDAVMQQGSHAIRLGFQVHRYRWSSESSAFRAGLWTFNSFESFLEGGAQGTTIRFGLPGGDNGRSYRQTLFGLYLQDQYRVSPSFQLNLGLRYEFVTIISERHGETVFLPDPLRDSAIQVGSILEKNPSLRSFAPRLGWRWAPFAGRNTVLQGGFGVYYDQIIGYSVIQRKSTSPFYLVVTNPNFDASDKFPSALAAASAPGATPPEVQVMDYRGMQTPTVLRYSFSMEQPLPGEGNLRASYVGARGMHLLRRYEANLFPAPVTLPDGSLFFPDDCTERTRLGLQPSALCRPGAGALNPAFGSVPKLGSDANSFYNSLQLSASALPGWGLTVQARYTYSKSVDDDSTAPNRSSAQNGFLRTLERALSDFDIRHQVSVNYFWTPPLGPGQSWLNSGVFGSGAGRLAVGWNRFLSHGRSYHDPGERPDSRIPVFTDPAESRLWPEQQSHRRRHGGMPGSGGRAGTRDPGTVF